MLELSKKRAFLWNALPPMEMLKSFGHEVVVLISEKDSTLPYLITFHLQNNLAEVFSMKNGSYSAEYYKGDAFGTLCL